MIYKSKAEALTIANVLAKLEGKQVVVPRVVYTSQEISSAKKVLDRLLAESPRSVTTIRKVTNNDSEE